MRGRKGRVSIYLFYFLFFFLLVALFKTMITLEVMVCQTFAASRRPLSMPWKRKERTSLIAPWWAMANLDRV